MAAAKRVKVLAVATMEVSGAALETIARWAVEGGAYLPITLHHCPTTYVVGWEDLDILATQGDAEIHVDARGLIKDAVPDDPVSSQNAPD